MLMNVVPTFVDMYENMGMGDELPTPTAVIMAMSEFVRSSGGFFLLVFIISFVLGFKYLVSKNYEVRKKWHQTMLKLPIFGNLIQKSILAKVSLVLGNLNQAGVDLIESIDIAKSVTDNVIVVEALENIKHLVDEKEVGVIAQDVEAVLPELVATREDGSKAVRYERLCAVLIESVKELKKK